MSVRVCGLCFVELPLLPQSTPCSANHPSPVSRYSHQQPDRTHSLDGGTPMRGRKPHRSRWKWSLALMFALGAGQVWMEPLFAQPPNQDKPPVLPPTTVEADQ